MIVEIRTYRLKPDATERFAALVRDEVLPLLAESGIRVARSGVSLIEEEGRRDGFLVRVFSSLEERTEQEEGFYGSDDWRLGPREAVLSCIDSYHTVIVETPDGSALLQAG